MTHRTTQQPTETRRRQETPFDEAQAAYRKIALLRAKEAKIRVGLSQTALAMLDAAADLERADEESEER